MHDTVDLHRVLGALHQAKAALKLDTANLCYLIALRVHAECGNLASLSDEELLDVYLQVCELTDPDAVNPRKRGTHAIQALRDHNLLRRVDGGGLVREGEYTLTRLAVAVVDFFLADETLTRESLAVLTRALTSQLGEVLSGARNAEDDEAWRTDVVEPLRVTVSDLVDGIERRQRGMDAQQEEVRERIDALLEEDWFSAVGECEELLDDTSTTLHELNEVLLHDCAHLQGLLQDIEEAATNAEADEAVTEAQKVQEHLDRVAAWGADRQRAWSDYYQFVQRYLRDVVRLDPDRAVSQRLRDQLAGWVDQPFALIVASEQPIRVLRDDQARVDRPPVTRQPVERDRELEIVSVDPAEITLDDRIAAALAAGARTLAELSEEVLRELPQDQHYRAAGRIAAIVAAQTRTSSPRERAWRELRSVALQIEDWELPPQGEA